MTSVAREHATKRRRVPEKRPQQILDAAFEVFGDHGLARARLDDIAKRAGIGKGTIYLYFPNKEALFKEMIRQTVIAHLERSERDLDGDRSATATAQLRDYMRELWTLVRSPAYQVVMRLVIAELHRFPELVEFYLQEVVSRKQQLLDRLIRRGVASGEFRSINPRVAGRMMASMFAMHALWASTGRCWPMLAAESDEELFGQLKDFFFHAVAPIGSPAGRSGADPEPPATAKRRRS
jgi:AcrR family transcriptional regulator